MILRKSMTVVSVTSSELSTSNSIFFCSDYCLIISCRCTQFSHFLDSNQPFINRFSLPHSALINLIELKILFYNFGSYLATKFSMATDSDKTSPSLMITDYATSSETSDASENLPAMPDSDAVVIALSPKSLMGTIQYICEICYKGFQRDQNLQLHRRGHDGGQLAKTVYICPEENCVRHDPSKAYGDFAGLKKHFYSRHVEKKWECDNCSKKYGVESDLKAHSKICGKKYNCVCGTLFSRRDSFIAHRAICDVLEEEKVRIPPISAYPRDPLRDTFRLSTLSMGNQGGSGIAASGGDQTSRLLAFTTSINDGLDITLATDITQDHSTSGSL